MSTDNTPQVAPVDAKQLLLAQRGKRSYSSAVTYINGQPLTVWFVSPMGVERDEFEASLLKRTGKGKRKKSTVDNVNIRARVIAFCACKGDGNPEKLFTPQEVAQLGELDAKILSPLFDEASKVAGLSDDDIEELEGNS